MSRFELKKTPKKPKNNIAIGQSQHAWGTTYFTVSI